MVSALSSRLLGGSGDSTNSSKGSSKKRGVSSLRPRTAHDGSASGYSADREEASTSPPLVTIDLYGENRSGAAARESNNCPKRRKRNEVQFAASSVKADLSRAGFEYPQIDKNIKETKSLKGVNIDLSGVKLMNSKDVKGPFVKSNVCARTSVDEFQQLVLACLDFYPRNPVRAQHAKLFESSQDSVRSTSSVSDTESDSGESNSVTQVLFIPPLLEDAISSQTKQQPLRTTDLGACNIISCGANAVTMNEMLQLTKTARIITNSSMPFSIIHANAAFTTLSGFQGEKIQGAPFSTILISGMEDKQASLPECVVASSTGNHKKLRLGNPPRIGSEGEGKGHGGNDDGKAAGKHDDDDDDDDASSDIQPKICRIQVSPVVARKSEASEISAVTHFSIEFFGLPDDDDDEESSMASSLSSSSRNRMLLAGNGEFPVGVMG